MKAPPRMCDDPTLSPLLRHDVASALAEPDPYDVAAGDARLAAALLAVPALESAAETSSQAAGGAGAQLAATGASGVLGSVALKLAAGAVFTAGVVAAGVLMWPQQTPPRPVSHDVPQSVAASPSPATPQPTPGDAAPSLAREAPERDAQDTGAQPQADTSAPTLRTAGSPRPARDMDAALRRETAQVGRIRSLLEADPAQAYRVAQAGHREFVRGMLREEREALAILSLRKLGRTALAERRTHAFVARYPQSALREQLEQHLSAEHERDAPAR